MEPWCSDISVDQEPCSSVSSGRWGRVLPAHMRKGSLLSSNADSFLPGFLLSVVLLALLGWGRSFLVGPLPTFVLNCVAGLRAASVPLAGCGAGLVDTLLNRTPGVRTTVGSSGEILCMVLLDAWYVSLE